MSAHGLNDTSISRTVDAVVAGVPDDLAPARRIPSAANSVNSTAKRIGMEMLEP